jgi:RNA polymerase sigma-70 factor (ECF subfamily)
MDNADARELDLEIALLKRTGEGDRASFAALYDRYAGILFSTAYRVLNSREAAEDVVQEVFVQIWEKAALYDPVRGKPLTWAMTLTRNKAIDRLRGAQRRARLQENMEREAETAERFDDRDSFSAVATIESGEKVRAALTRLSKEQREAIELAFFHSLTQAEIAERLGEPLGTVKARIRRGLLKLRDLVAAKI